MKTLNLGASYDLKILISFNYFLREIYIYIYRHYDCLYIILFLWFLSNFVLYKCFSFFFLFYNVIYIVTFTKYISKLKNKKEKVLMHSTNIKTLTVRYIEKIIHTVQLDMRSIQCKCAIRFAATQLKCI